MRLPIPADTTERQVKVYVQKRVSELLTNVWRDLHQANDVITHLESRTRRTNPHGDQTRSLITQVADLADEDHRSLRPDGSTLTRSVSFRPVSGVSINRKVQVMSRKVSVRNDEETGMSEVIEVEETEPAPTNESLSPWQLITELPAARVLHTPDAFQMELLEEGVKGVTAKTGFSVLSRHPVNQQTHVRVLTDAAGTILVVLGTVINRVPVVEATGESHTSPTGEEIPVMRQVRGNDGRPMFSTQWEIYGVAPFRSLAHAQQVARDIQNQAIMALHVVAGWGDPVDQGAAEPANDWGEFVDVNDDRDFVDNE